MARNSSLEANKMDQDRVLADKVLHHKFLLFFVGFIFTSLEL
jgi:hypothetical protein